MKSFIYEVRRSNVNVNRRMTDKRNIEIVQLLAKSHILSAIGDTHVVYYVSYNINIRKTVDLLIDIKSVEFCPAALFRPLHNGCGQWQKSNDGSSVA